MAEEGFDSESTGVEFFRCVLCGAVVSQWDIAEHHGCGKCGGFKIKPTNLSLWEKIIQIIMHPLFWKWGVQDVRTDKEG